MSSNLFNITLDLGGVAQTTQLFLAQRMARGQAYGTVKGWYDAGKEVIHDIFDGFSIGSSQANKLSAEPFGTQKERTEKSEQVLCAEHIRNKVEENIFQLQQFFRLNDDTQFEKFKKEIPLRKIDTRQRREAWLYKHSGSLHSITGVCIGVLGIVAMFGSLGAWPLTGCLLGMAGLVVLLVTLGRYHHIDKISQQTVNIGKMVVAAKNAKNDHGQTSSNNTVLTQPQLFAEGRTTGLFLGDDITTLLAGPISKELVQTLIPHILGASGHPDAKYVYAALVPVGLAVVGNNFIAGIMAGVLCFASAGIGLSNHWKEQQEASRLAKAFLRYQALTQPNGVQAFPAVAAAPTRQVVTAGQAVLSLSHSARLAKPAIQIVVVAYCLYYCLFLNLATPVWNSDLRIWIIRLFVLIGVFYLIRCFLPKNTAAASSSESALPATADSSLDVTNNASTDDQYDDGAGLS